MCDFSNQTRQISEKGIPLCPAVSSNSLWVLFSKKTCSAAEPDKYQVATIHLGGKIKSVQWFLIMLLSSFRSELEMPPFSCVGANQKMNRTLRLLYKLCEASVFTE